MRACDHKTLQDLHVFEALPPEQQREFFNIPPFYLSDKYSAPVRGYKIPADKISPRIDPNMERCKGN